MNSQLMETAKTEWVQRRLGDDCTVGDGTHARLERLDAGVLYVTAKNLKESGLNLWKVGRISEADFNKHFRSDTRTPSRPRSGDVLMGIIGTIGIPYLMKPEDRFGLSSSVGIIRPNQEVLWPAYLYYWVKGEVFQNALHGIVGGVVQPYVSMQGLKSLPLRYPCLEKQRKIAEILSAYDELIAINLQRMKLLESMARTIFREWFVYLRFPGWEGVKIVESKVGRIPETWEVTRIGDAMATVSGDTPSTKNPEYWENGDMTWFTPTDLTNAGTMFISESARKVTELGRRKSKTRVFPPYSVMVTSRATIGVVAINVNHACTNQGFITCIPNERLSPYFMYFWVEENKDRMSSLASGVMFKEIYLSNFRKVLMAVPDRETHRQFVAAVEPVCKQIEVLQEQTSNLRRTRDLLMSGLLSGKLDVGGIS